MTYTHWPHSKASRDLQCFKHEAKSIADKRRLVAHARYMADSYEITPYLWKIIHELGTAAREIIQERYLMHFSYLTQTYNILLQTLTTSQELYTSLGSIYKR